MCYLPIALLVRSEEYACRVLYFVIYAHDCTMPDTCAIALGEHFPSMADHSFLLASSSLGFGSMLRSHFSVRKLERFLHTRLVLRRLHLWYLHSPLARLSQLGISWRLRGLLSLLCAGCLCGREFISSFFVSRFYVRLGHKYKRACFPSCIIICYFGKNNNYFTCIGRFFRCKENGNPVVRF